MNKYAAKTEWHRWALNQVPKAAVPESEIMRCRSWKDPKGTSGAWTRQQLAMWGVPWPPPHGWKEKLQIKGK